MNAFNSNLSLAEKARYAPQTIDSDSLVDALQELEEYRELAADSHNYSPSELSGYIDSIESSQCPEEHKQLDDYKQAFETIFNSWENSLADGQWPSPEPWDNNLINAITRDMERGAAAINALKELVHAIKNGDNSDEYLLSIIAESGALGA